MVTLNWYLDGRPIRLTRKIRYAPDNELIKKSVCVVIDSANAADAVRFIHVVCAHRPGWPLSTWLDTHPRAQKASKRVIFWTYNVVDVFCKKGIIFAAYRTLGVPEWGSEFAWYAAFHQFLLHFRLRYTCRIISFLLQVNLHNYAFKGRFLVNDAI